MQILAVVSLSRRVLWRGLRTLEEQVADTLVMGEETGGQGAEAAAALGGILALEVTAAAPKTLMHLA
jgi:hypothetical protein